MSSSFSSNPTPSPMSVSPEPTPQPETKDCPICMGAGQVPITMSKEEMIESLNQQGEPSTDQLGQDTGAIQAPRPGQEPLDDSQVAEVNRLSTRARDRMSGGPQRLGY